MIILIGIKISSLCLIIIRLLVEIILIRIIKIKNK